MLDAYGRPVLADFGVAAPIGELEPGRLDGFSVLWAPPEQQDARTHAHPTQDVWALAATTWTLLTGRSPFEDPLGDNGSLTYNVNGFVNHMSPDNHFQDLKRIISASVSTAKRVNVIMPFLYESRQHKRTKRESLDCALSLEELVNMGVSNIITFDAHDPRVQNAIPSL